MHLVQLLLPLNDSLGQPYGDEVLRTINATLASQFGGVTAFLRSPAKGRWINNHKVERDDVVVVEVMASILDHAWWASFRSKLENTLDQKEIVLRALASVRAHLWSQVSGEKAVQSIASGPQPKGG